MTETIFESEMKKQKSIGTIIKYALFIITTLLLSQILTVEFFRGIIELILALGSFLAYQRSRSDLIQKVTIIAAIVLLLMGIYDITSAFGLI